MADILPPVPYDLPQTSFEWVDWYTKLRTQINSTSTDHNQLTNIQGGTAAEYYHLDLADYNALQGARVTKGTDTTDDVIIDSTTKGLVLKSPNGHYWRASISNAGVITWTDVGTTKP